VANDSKIYGFANILLPDERMSLHSGDRYPHVFTAGNCSMIKSKILPGSIRTDSVKANFHLGYIAALNMLEVHYPFDDVIVNNIKLLDKNLIFIGNDGLAGTWNNMVLHKDEKNEQFICYLFNDRKITSVVLYGFKRYHIFIREAMRMNMLPSLEFVSAHKAETHLFITKELLKNSDLIECFKHKALSVGGSVDTTKYSVEDQTYVQEMMARGAMAIKEMKQKIMDNEDKTKQQEEDAAKKKGKNTN
jgi:hypothetical protein